MAPKLPYPLDVLTAEQVPQQACSGMQYLHRRESHQGGPGQMGHSDWQVDVNLLVQIPRRVSRYDAMVSQFTIPNSRKNITSRL